LEPAAKREQSFFDGPPSGIAQEFSVAHYGGAADATIHTHGVSRIYMVGNLLLHDDVQKPAFLLPNEVCGSQSRTIFFHLTRTFLRNRLFHIRTEDEPSVMSLRSGRCERPAQAGWTGSTLFARLPWYLEGTTDSQSRANKVRPLRARGGDDGMK
jgi:hypothetical protein